jgi:hypothetical protein
MKFSMAMLLGIFFDYQGEGIMKKASEKRLFICVYNTQ